MAHWCQREVTLVTPTESHCFSLPASDLPARDGFFVSILSNSGRQALPTQELEASARLIGQQLSARNPAGAEEPPDRLHPAPGKGFPRLVPPRLCKQFHCIPQRPRKSVDSTSGRFGIRLAYCHGGVKTGSRNRGDISRLDPGFCQRSEAF